jgi:lysophospholipase L1-like esterase
VVLYGVSVERDGPGVIVDALGVPGSMARSWLERNPVLNQEGLRRLDPDLLVLAYGTNEANDTSYALETYQQDLDLVLREMRYALPDTPCLLVGPSDRVETSRRPGLADRTQAVAEIQRRTAPVHSCVFWDWQQATGGPGSQAAWRAHDPPLVASDLLHYTPEGYQASAELLLLALDTPSP